tara:strand:- start:799 stop:5604 length:4806 start_codon:yes stop_codon:yes gene_type:complete
MRLKKISDLFLHSIKLLMLFYTCTVFSSEHFGYRGEFFDSRSEAQTAVTNYVQVTNKGEYVELVQSTEGLDKYNVYFNPVEASPNVHYSPCYANSICSSEGESLGAWEDQTKPQTDSRCSEPSFDKAPSSGKEFSGWGSISGDVWSQQSGVFVKIYTQPYQGNWTYEEYIPYSDGTSACVTQLPIEESATIYHYTAYKCPAGSSRVDTPAGESGLPKCFSNVEYVAKTQCYSPFTFDEGRAASSGMSNFNACTTYCPPDHVLDTNLGQCISNKDDRDQCESKSLNPIDTFLGEKQQSFVDFQQTDELPLVFARTYKSMRAPKSLNHMNSALRNNDWSLQIQSVNYKGSIAYTSSSFNAEKQGNVQWRHNYQYQLITASTGFVSVVLPNGSKRRFQIISGIHYVPNVQMGDRLEKVDNSYIYVSSENTKYYFNSLNQLSSIKVVDGKQLSLVYDASGKLESVTNSHGESLQYGYNSSNLLSTIQLPNLDEIKLEYDNIYNLISVTYPDDTPLDPLDDPTEHYHYENSVFPHALTGITDANGTRYATWTYNSDGQAIASEHANGVEAGNVSYDLINRTTSIQNASGKTSTVNYLKNGRVQSVSGESCSTSGQDGLVTFSYDSKGRVSNKVVENGSAIATTYATNGLPATVTIANGTAVAQKTSITYGATNPLPTKIVHPNGLIESFTYNTAEQVELHTLSDGVSLRTTTYSYNTNGLVLSIDGPRTDVNDITTYQYDSLNRLLSVTNALNQTISFSNYNAFGIPTSITDANGVTTTLTLDARGRTTSTSVSGETNYFEYDNIGQLTQQISADGTITSYVYDDARRLTKMSNSLGDSINYSYDNASNLISTQIKGTQQNILYQQSQLFDQVNRLSQVIDSSGSTWSYEYDASNNLTKVNTPTNTNIAYLHDAINRVVQTTERDNSATLQTYNKQNLATSVIDAESHTTQYTYNLFGEVTSTNSIDTGVTSYTYDLAGNLVSKTDARNITIHYAYDALNRLVSVTYPDTTENEVFGYDDNALSQNGVGRLTSLQKNGLQYQYFYDAMGQLTKVDTLYSKNELTLNSSIEYQYTEELLIGVTYPSGNQVNYTYLHGNVSSMSLNVTDAQGQSTAQNLASSINYLPFGDVTSLTYGNGKLLTQSFDLSYQLSSKKVVGIFDKNYTFNTLGDISDIADLTTPATNQTFEYDVVQRLADAQGSYGALAFSYDAIGNRLTKTVNGVDDIYQYSNNRLQTAANKTMTYDANGNLTSRGAETYSYNDANRLENALVTSGTYTYDYNPLGQRVIKDSNGQKRFYHYDPSGLLLAETDQNGQTLVEYYYLNGQRLAINLAGTIYYVHTNHLDAPLALTDANGTVVWQASYTPFGEISSITNNLPASFTARFPGQYADDESGFYYNYFRDYDPEIGRYIQSDRLGLFDGPNTYGYAHQNPIMYTDPTGEFVPQILGFAFGAGLEYFTNPCATASDILLSGALGALGGGFGAKIGLKFAGNKGLNKQFSHLIPSRYIRKNSPHYKRWLDNKLGRGLIKGNNKWNGNYVSVKRHFKHDPYAWGNKAFPGKTLGQKWNPVRGLLDRVPNTWWGTGTGAGIGAGAGQLAPKSGECGCGT